MTESEPAPSAADTQPAAEISGFLASRPASALQDHGDGHWRAVADAGLLLLSAERKAASRQGAGGLESSRAGGDPRLRLAARRLAPRRSDRGLARTRRGSGRPRRGSRGGGGPWLPWNPHGRARTDRRRLRPALRRRRGGKRHRGDLPRRRPPRSRPLRTRTPSGSPRHALGEGPGSLPRPQAPSVLGGAPWTGRNSYRAARLIAPQDARPSGPASAHQQIQPKAPAIQSGTPDP